MRLTDVQIEKMLRVIDGRIERAEKACRAAYGRFLKVPGIPVTVMSPYAQEGAFDACVKAMGEIERQRFDDCWAAEWNLSALRDARRQVANGHYPANW